jgi:hypothetical protein
VFGIFARFESFGRERRHKKKGEGAASSGSTTDEEGLPRGRARPPPLQLCSKGPSSASHFLVVVGADVRSNVLLAELVLPGLLNSSASRPHRGLLGLDAGVLNPDGVSPRRLLQRRT